MNDTDVRVLQVIYLAQMVGATLFAGVVVFLAQQASQQGAIPDAGQLATARMLSAVLVIMIASIYPAAGVVYRRILTSQTRSSLSRDQIFPRIKTAYIVRMALFEGVAFFGLVVCLICGNSGVLRVYPAYWLSSVPYFLLIGLGTRTFPSKDRLESVMNQVAGGSLA